MRLPTSYLVSSNWDVRFGPLEGRLRVMKLDGCEARSAKPKMIMLESETKERLLEIQPSEFQVRLA